MASPQNTSLTQNTSWESTGIEDTGIEFEFSRMEIEPPATAFSSMNFSLLSDINNEETMYYAAEDGTQGIDSDFVDAHNETQGADSESNGTNENSDETNEDLADDENERTVSESSGSDEDDDALTKIENLMFKKAFGKSSFDPRKIPTHPKPWNEWSLADFEYGKRLGSGTYGDVNLSRTTREKYIVALKVMKEIAISRPDLIEREFNNHIQLSHPNIIKLYGSFVHNARSVFVLEYAPGGDVFKHMMDQPQHRFTDDVAATYIDQVADALQYLHSLNIIHRDIKPENLLLGYFGEIKMADFGHSYQLESSSAHRKRYTYCGTHGYLSPEMITGKGHDERADIWALGVLTYEFLVGRPPFAGDDPDKPEVQATEIEEGLLMFPDVVSSIARDFIGKILYKHPEGRISLEKIRKHIWVIQNKFKERKGLLSCFDKFKHMESIVTKKYKAAREDLMQRRNFEI